MVRARVRLRRDRWSQSLAALRLSLLRAIQLQRDWCRSSLAAPSRQLLQAARVQLSLLGHLLSLRGGVMNSLKWRLRPQLVRRAWLASLPPRVRMRAAFQSLPLFILSEARRLLSFRVLQRALGVTLDHGRARLQRLLNMPPLTGLLPTFVRCVGCWPHSTCDPPGSCWGTRRRPGRARWRPRTASSP